MEHAALVCDIESAADTGFLTLYASETDALDDLSHGWAFFAYEDGTAVGVIVVTQKAGPLQAVIELLAVRKEYQRRRIARTLMARALEELKEVPTVELTTRVGNPARTLYERFDFVVKSVEEDMYGDGKPRYIMSWEGPRTFAAA